MRVLHVISQLDPHQGGPAYALRGLAEHQARSGLAVTCLVGVRPSDEPTMADELAALGVRIVRTGPCRGPLAMAPDMRAKAEACVAEADVVHVHAIWMQIQHEAARAARRAGRPYIFRACGMLDPWCLAQSRLKKRLYMAWRLRRDLDGAVRMHYTTETERRLAESLRLRPRAVVEPNGVDLAEFAAMPAPDALRRRFPTIGDRRILLFLSRVHLKKGLDLLIPAFAKARRDDWMLVIAGADDRNYLAVAQALVRQHGIERDVLFTGLLRGPDRLEAFAAAELFCLPSYQENFGVAVVEALAAGLPVVISDQVNICREVESAGAGAVVPCAVDPLAEALAAWMADDGRRAAAAARARPFVHETYDWSRIAARWADHYATLVEEAARSRAG